MRRILLSLTSLLLLPATGWTTSPPVGRCRGLTGDYRWFSLLDKGTGLWGPALSGAVIGAAEGASTNHFLPFSHVIDIVPEARVFEPKTIAYYTLAL